MAVLGVDAEAYLLHVIIKHTSSPKCS
eukprot:COSAG01_NODE_50531_length_362_cov_2.041825_1_plen_26_part_10